MHHLLLIFFRSVPVIRSLAFANEDFSLMSQSNELMPAMAILLEELNRAQGESTAQAQQESTSQSALQSLSSVTASQSLSSVTASFLLNVQKLTIPCTRQTDFHILSQLMPSLKEVSLIWAMNIIPNAQPKEWPHLQTFSQWCLQMKYQLTVNISYVDMQGPMEQMPAHLGLAGVAVPRPINQRFAGIQNMHDMTDYTPTAGLWRVPTIGGNHDGTGANTGTNTGTNTANGLPYNMSMQQASHKECDRLLKFLSQFHGIPKKLVISFAFMQATVLNVGLARMLLRLLEGDEQLRSIELHFPVNFPMIMMPRLQEGIEQRQQLSVQQINEQAKQFWIIMDGTMSTDEAFGKTTEADVRQSQDHSQHRFLSEYESQSLTVSQHQNQSQSLTVSHSKHQHHSVTQPRSFKLSLCRQNANGRFMVCSLPVESPRDIVISRMQRIVKRLLSSPLATMYRREILWEIAELFLEEGEEEQTNGTVIQAPKFRTLIDID